MSVVTVNHEWELHCHSQASDGALSVADLLSRAAERGVRHLALTDHDTAAGYREAVRLTQRPANLQLYPAAELSAVWSKRTVHIVALGIDPYSEAWRAIEDDYQQRRTDRFSKIVQRLNKKGFEIDQSRLLDGLPDGAVPGRPHIAKYLLDTNQIKDTATAYKKWLGAGKVGDVKQNWPEMSDVVGTINAVGGMAVIAHPHRYKLTWTKLRELLDDFTEAGGGAVEAACTGIHPDLFRFLAQQALERDLYVSGGSDFHSPSQSFLDLGRYPALPSNAKPVYDWLQRRMQSLTLETER